MKPLFYSLVIVLAFSNNMHSQSLDKAVNDVKKKAQKEFVKYTQPKATPLTNDEVVRGLKEALNVGTNNSTASCSKADGFYKNQLITIPFPAEAEKIKNTVIKLGMQKQVDEFVLTLNRSAEEASKEAAPIFIEAIKNMSVEDGFKILKGEDNAATEFLKNKTTSSLLEKFMPIVKKAISKVELTKYWNPIMTSYNMVPGVQKQNPDLEKYVTTKAIEGLFKLIAGEEKKIRKDPLAQITDLLKRVFGAK